MTRLVAVALVISVTALAQDENSGHEEHQESMIFKEAGIVMNQNTDTLPRGCDSISTDHKLEIRAGREYASDAPGLTYGYSEHEVKVDPCSRVTVTLVNDDDVRHQWMVHGLPKYLYPAGMFHIEAMGGESMTGTFIVPVESKNYLIHCDMTQHMEKGMRGQIVVGKGGGDLWGVNGVSDQFLRSSYLPENTLPLVITAILAGILAALFIGYRL